MRSAATFLTLLGALVGASACGSDIDLPTGAGTTGSGAGSSTSGAGASSATGSTGSSGAGAGSGSSGAGAGSSGAGAGSGSSGAGAGSGSSGSGGAGAGSSTSASSSSSGGTPPSKACSDCAQLAVEGPCKPAFDACNASFACSTLLECHGKCDWTAACNADCDEIIPSGVPVMSDLLGCIACEQCVLPCTGSSLTAYCP